LAKLFLRLIKHQAMKTFAGVGSPILRGRFRRKESWPRYPFEIRKGATSAVLNALMKKMCRLLLPSIRLRFLSRPDRSLVTVATDIFRQSGTSEIFLCSTRSYRRDRVFLTVSLSPCLSTCLAICQHILRGESLK
jgi:hypothetical protein